MTETQAWKDGIWAFQDKESLLLIINGTNFEYKDMIHLDYPNIKSRLFGTLTSGDFGEAPENIKTLTGVERYNLQMKSHFMEKGAVLSEDGRRIYTSSFMSGIVDILEWADESRLQKLRDNREPVDAPSLPSYYTPQPERPGKLLWFTGPPGSGKSTCAQLMARHHGYIYFEGDAYFGYANPYIDIHEENPSMARMTQKSLKGVSPDIIKIMHDSSEAIQNMMKGVFDGMDGVIALAMPPYTDNIKQQRKRLGGNMAIASWGLYERKQRQQALELLGEDVVFLVLNMTKDCQKKRIDARHAGSGLNLDLWMNIFDLHEPAGEDEKNAFNVNITEDMSPDDVTKEVLKIVQKL